MVVDAFEEDAFLLRRSPGALGAAATLRTVGVIVGVIAGVTVAAALAWWAGLVALGFWVAWVGVGAALYGLVRCPGGAPLPVHVRAVAGSLSVESVDGITTWQAAQIAGGWLQPRPRAAPVVHIRGPAGQQVRLVVRDVEQGRCLLRALGIDASRVAAHYWAMARPLGEPRAFAHAGALLGLTIAFGLITGPAAPPVFSVALVALVVLCAGVTIPTRVVVGADGVLLRWLGTVRFVAWSRVSDVQPFDGGVLLTLPHAQARAGDAGHAGHAAAAEHDAGERLTLRMPEDHERYHPERDAMVERMLAAFRAHGPPREEPLTRVLDRAGGVTRDWVRTMRALVCHTPGFRTAAIPAARLWQVVEDPRADRTLRTGAAIALAPMLDPPGRLRLATAAAGCAEPRLRMALRTAVTQASAGDDALAEALDALETEGDDEPPRAARG
jgi:hypothetical protein